MTGVLKKIYGFPLCFFVLVLMSAAEALTTDHRPKPLFCASGTLDEVMHFLHPATHSSLVTGRRKSQRSKLPNQNWNVKKKQLLNQKLKRKEHMRK